MALFIFPSLAVAFRTICIRFLCPSRSVNEESGPQCSSVVFHGCELLVHTGQTTGSKLNSKQALVLTPLVCLLPAPKERQKDSFVLECRVGKLLRQWQVLQPCTAVILLSIAVFPFSLMFISRENICDVEINSCRINHKHICGEQFLSEWPWL